MTCAPAFRLMPPQYTPGLMVSVFFEEKLCLSHPENDGYDESAYGSEAGVAPVLIPSVVVIFVIFDVPDTLPTTFTESAERVPPQALRPSAAVTGSGRRDHDSSGPAAPAPDGPPATTTQVALTSMGWSAM